MEKKTVHVLLTYVLDDKETYCNLFTSKQAVVDYVLDGIKRDYLDIYGEKMDDETKADMETDLADAKKSLDTRGYWRDANENEYVYDEKEFTA